MALAGVVVEQGVQGGDAQAGQVRRRGQVGLVGDAAARVEAHEPGAQPGAHVGGELARVAVVAGDDDGRDRGVAVGEGGDERGPQRERDERAAALLVQALGVRMGGDLGEEGAQRHGGFGHAERPGDHARRGTPPV